MLIDTIQAAKLLQVSASRVRILLKQGRIRGAYKLGRFWVIPLYDGMPIISKGKRGPKTTLEPVISVKCGNRNVYGHTVEINGPCRIVYSPEQTFLGARVWIETFSKVEVFCRDFISRYTSL